MDSDFMSRIADGLFAENFEVVRFEFPYMQERRETGKKRPPDRAPKLLEAFHAQVTACGGPEKCVLAGKSMGGRMASMLAAEISVKGVLCLGYPFHAPGKLDKVRIEHFAHVHQPVLILQGERDPFGKRDEAEGYTLSKSITMDFLPDGDHDLKPRKASGRTGAENWADAVDRIAEFVGRL